MADSRLADLEKAGVRTVRMTYPDLHGISRGKDYPIEHFRHLVEDGGGFCEAIMTVDLRHVVTAGFEHGFQDILARARPRHARADPVGARHVRGASPTSTAHGRRALRGRPARRRAAGGRRVRRPRPARP